MFGSLVQIKQNDVLDSANNRKWTLLSSPDAKGTKLSNLSIKFASIHTPQRSLMDVL